MNNQKLEIKVNDCISKQIEEKGYATIKDTLMMIGWLQKTDYNAWRNGKIEYLERACHTNLSKLSYLNKLYRGYANSHNYKLSYTQYYSNKYKKPLRFSKYGRREVESGYAMHIVKPKVINNKK